MTKSRNILRKKKQWSAEEDALLRALYPCSKAQALAKLFTCQQHQVYRRVKALEIKKSDWFKRNPLMSGRLIDHEVGKAYRFKKGQIPPNKGKKVGSFPGMEKTQFKPGQKPINWLPPGSTRLCSKQGYVLMKMSEGINKWRPIHRIIYKRMHGKIPHDQLVTFVDGNRQNISITNLTTVNKKQHCINNSVQNFPPEIKELYQIKGQITRQINKREREKS